MDRLFRHEAVPYAGADAFVAAATSVVREGLENDERTLVLASARRVHDLQDALGGDAAEVTFIASDQHARNPTRVAMLLDTFAGGSSGPTGSSLAVNDTGPGRTRAVTLETRFADSLLNVAAVRTWAVSLLCLFDLQLLDPDAHHSMRQGHGVVRGSDTNVHFEPELAARLYATLPDAAPPTAVRCAIGAGGLAEARAFVRAASAGHRLRADRVDDLVLAVNEIVTNSLRHGGGRADVAVWFEDGAVVCEVRDGGFIADPLTGRFAPAAAASSGRGIWLVHNLCDLVQLRSSPGGTVVRMYVDR